MELTKQYARLKVRAIAFAKEDDASQSFSIDRPHLIVTLLAPEVPEDVEREFSRRNLKPYELACRAMGNSDYLYDQSQIQNAGPRLIQAIDLVTSNTPADSDTAFICVVYLEFND